MSLLSLLNWEAFTSVWFWLILVTQSLWRSVHVMGIPTDILHQPDPAPDTEVFVRFRLSRTLGFITSTPLLVICLLSAGVGLLIVLATVYNIDMAQALCILILPQIIILCMNVHCVKKLNAKHHTWATKTHKLKWLHLQIQVIGAVVIFATTLLAAAKHFPTL